MDKKYIKDHNVIDRYLTGQLSEEELNQFSFKMMRDEKLQKEVQANRLLYKTLWKQTMNPPSDKSNTNSILGILGILALIIAAYFLIPSNSTTLNTPTVEAPLADSAKQESTPIIPIEGKEASEPEKENIPKKNKPIASKQEKTKSETSPTPIQKVEPKKPVLIAANFETNPLLENYFTQKRGGSFSVESPKQIAQFSLKNGVLPFEIKGQFQPDTDEIEEPIYFYLFSNKKEDYEEFRPLVMDEISFEADEEDKAFTFQWEQSFSIEPGLYYYQIEGEDSGLFYVGKFEAK